MCFTSSYFEKLNQSWWQLFHPLRLSCMHSDHSVLLSSQRLKKALIRQKPTCHWMYWSPVIVQNHSFWFVNQNFLKHLSSLLTIKRAEICDRGDFIRHLIWGLLNIPSNIIIPNKEMQVMPCQLSFTHPFANSLLLANLSYLLLSFLHRRALFFIKM